jgi:hypothetical protein
MLERLYPARGKEHRLVIRLPLAACLAVVAGCGAAPMDDPASADGTSVTTSTGALKSEDYVRGPRGRFHKSCVHEVPNGSTVDEDLNVFVDGRKIKRLEKCKYPALPSRAPTTCPGGACWALRNDVPGTVNAWGLHWFNAVGADWTVPQVPTTFANQVIFFFPGLSPQLSGVIIQPVLQFGVSAAGGGNYWAMANWLVAGGGTTVVHSPLVTVSPGTSIHGEMDALWNSCSMAGVCNWSINYVLGGTWYSLNVSPGVTLDWAFKGVLEAYDSTGTSYPANCAHYPASGTTNFTGFFASQPGPGTNDWNTPNWTGNTWVASGLPSCGFGVNDFAGSNGYDGAAYLGY